jgi:hypothetical protein
MEQNLCQARRINGTDYSAVPYTTNYRGPTAPVGWYWNDSQKRYYWFDGTTLAAAQQ